MRIGSLFTGYGGLDVAVEAVFGASTVWTCDHDPTVAVDKHGPSKIIAARFPDAPNLGDITGVDWANVEPVDIITAGFPCQDVSAAGRRAGLRPGTRTGLWSHVAYAVDQLRPRFLIAENVRGLLSADADSDVEPCPWCVGDRPGGHLRALGAVLADLADIGYDARWCGLRAADVGAPHGRFRIFLLAADAADTGGETRNVGPGLRPDEPGRVGRRRLGDSGGETPLLPTPRARDHKGRDPNPNGVDLNEAVSLLPTPTAVPYGNNQSGSPGAVVRPSLDGVAQLLPTPSAADGLGGHERRGGGRGDELLLPGVVKDLLPTPTVVDANGGRNATANRSSGAADFHLGWTLSDVAYVDRFGEYAEAVARWVPIVGRPAPDPTVDGRLSPWFVEWMQGLPAGWVCDVAGLSRAQQLRLLGNGVVPQQAAAALRFLLDPAVVA